VLFAARLPALATVLHALRWHPKATMLAAVLGAVLAVTPVPERRPSNA
jgi:hypothetical protein